MSDVTGSSRPLGSRISECFRTAARVVRRRPRLLLWFLLDLVIVVSLDLAVLAAIGELDSFGAGVPFWLFLVLGIWEGRLTAAHRALQRLDSGGQITVAELVRAHQR